VIKQADILRLLHFALDKEVGRQPDQWWSFPDADTALLTVVAWGPWSVQRQEKVAKQAILKAAGKKIHELPPDIKLYPLRFQNQIINRMTRYLRNKGISLEELCSRLRKHSADAVRRFLLAVVGLRRSKVIECFIRDYLHLDSFPLDRWAIRTLKKFGLPTDERKIVRLCKEAKINPRELNRQIYEAVLEGKLEKVWKKTEELIKKWSQIRDTSAGSTL